MLGEPERAAELRAEAASAQAALQRGLLDGGGRDVRLRARRPEKRLVRSVASNAGHCLWSGIAARSAPAAVARLLAPDMFERLGHPHALRARTRPSIPFYYQHGSVWPHDNAIIAAGMKRYGDLAADAPVAKAILDAQAGFDRYRLPELFAGLQRDATSFPVQYLGANIPQAWAAGAIFMLLRAILGITADAPHNRPDRRARPCRTGCRASTSAASRSAARLHLRFWREGGLALGLIGQRGEQTTSKCSIAHDAHDPGSEGFTSLRLRDRDRSGNARGRMSSKGHPEPALQFPNRREAPRGVPLHLCPLPAAGAAAVWYPLARRFWKQSRQ